MASSQWLGSFFCVIIFALLGFWFSLLASLALPLVLVLGYLIKIKISWRLQWLSAIGLLVGVFPLWASVAWLTSDTTTSLVFSVQIILVPALWLLAAWLQVRFGHRLWAHLRH